MNNNQEESPKIQKNKRQKLRNSKPQEFVLKTFDDMDATIKKKNKKVRHSVLLSKALQIKNDKSPKKRRKKESIDDITFQKTDINTIADKILKEKKKQNTLPIKLEKKIERKEEEKKVNENLKATVSTRKRLPSYYEKYPKRPKQSFYSTSKNPKINQILNTLRENGEIKLKDDTNKEVGKIDSDTIVKYNKFFSERYYLRNYKKEIDPKIKDTIDKINKSSEQSSAIISNQNLPYIEESNEKLYTKTEPNFVEEDVEEEKNDKEKKEKKNKKKKKKRRNRKKSYSSGEEEQEEESEEELEEESEEESEEEIESSSNEERKKNKNNKKPKKKNFKNLNFTKKEYALEPISYNGFSNSNNFNIEENKFKRIKRCVDYQEFSFNFYVIGKKEFISRKNNKIEYIPERQVEVTLMKVVKRQSIEKIIRNKGNVATIVKNKNNIKKINRPKKSSIQYDEKGYLTSDNEEYSNTRKYNIVGFDKKTKRMSIIDILKKRKISIKSEEPFKTQTFLESIKQKEKIREKQNKINNALVASKEKKNEEKEPEIQETEEGVHYLIFTCSVTIRRERKCKPKDFKPSHEVSVNLKGSIQLMMEEEDDENDEGEILSYKNKKVNRNYLVRNKNTLYTIHNNKKLNKTLNNSSNLGRKKVNYNKDEKTASTLDKSADITKNNFRQKMIFGDTIYKKKKKSGSSNKKNQKDIFNEDNEDTEEEEKEEEKEENYEMLEEEEKKIRNKKFNDLLHAYGSNNFENKKVKFNEKVNAEKKDKNDSIRNRSGSRNSAMNNKVTSKDIYTDKKTNLQRKSFKQKLANNEYINNNEENYSSKNVHKVKADKAKIRKFRSKNENENHIMSKKSTGHGKLEELQRKIKMKKFQNCGRKNMTSDFINNNNNNLHNFNNKTFNYYTIDFKKKIIQSYANNHSINNKKRRNYLTGRNNTKENVRENAFNYYTIDFKKHIIQSYANNHSINNKKKINYLTERNNTKENVRDSKSAKIRSKIKVIKSKNKTPSNIFN